MRRFALILVSCVCLQLSAATPAHAWWDYIEQFSGPGPFRGGDVEARIVCFREDDNAKVTASWGVILPICPINSGEGKRRGSIDLGVRFLTRTGDPRWANGERINLVTLEPAFSWNLIPGKKFDVLDVGGGAGIYWFSSPEFEPHRGFFLEPIRLDLHGPTVWKSSKWSVLVPVARVGLLVFPNGFAPDAFAPAPAQARRLPAEVIPAYSFFFDLEALFRSKE